MKKFFSKTNIGLLSILGCTGLLAAGAFYGGVFYPTIVQYGIAGAASSTPIVPTLDIFAYNKKMIEIANFGTTTEATGIIATSSAWFATSSSISSPRNAWPVSTTYPKVGALLPFHRIFAYYGNFYSANMGILGEYPPDVMLGKLKDEVAHWQAADPTTPIIPAIDYIAVVAQGSPGPDGKYRLRMPDSEIEKAITLALEVNGLVFLDVQPGFSNVQTEIPLLEKYLMLPEVHLGIDPEFSMKTGALPGTKIGTMNSDDVNFSAEYLASLVKKYNLPPKILLVHRFTENMVIGYEKVKTLPEVQIVLNMDGWGLPKNKIKTYHDVVTTEPIQFTGIKLFYKNDLRAPSPGLLTPEQTLNLKPSPVFVEYQ